ncbi:MAG: hypothetical protein JXK04_00935 [Campylobacterales bacterium]|nr:hypothetical protein [Campylobacterales bacterium]
MSELETQLDTIDEQLLTYGPAQRWLIYIGSAAGILLMGWMFYLSDALAELSELEEQNQALVQQIGENSPEAYRSKISQTAAAIAREKSRADALDNEKQALLAEMSARSGLVFNNRTYAQMLQRLLERSVRLGLKIEQMESEDTAKPFFGKIIQYKKLTVTGTGNYPAIADFLTFVEEQNTLVQIDTVQIRSDEEKPRFEAVIFYMGVAL